MTFTLCTLCILFGIILASELDLSQAILKPDQAYILNTSTDQARARAFITCRRECVNRCDRLVYRYQHNVHYCHECLRECMYGFINQAIQVNVDFNAMKERSQRKSRSHRHNRKSQPDTAEDNYQKQFTNNDKQRSMTRKRRRTSDTWEAKSTKDQLSLLAHD